MTCIGPDWLRPAAGCGRPPQLRSVTIDRVGNSRGARACAPPEREVITLLSDGLSNAEIARTLFISEKTASVHVSNILRKLGVTSRIQAAAHSRSAPAD